MAGAVGRRRYSVNRKGGCRAETLTRQFTTGTLTGSDSEILTTP